MTSDLDGIINSLIYFTQNDEFIEIFKTNFCFKTAILDFTVHTKYFNSTCNVYLNCIVIMHKYAYFHYLLSMCIAVTAVSYKM